MTTVTEQDRVTFEQALQSGRPATLYTPTEVISCNVRMIVGPNAPELRYDRCQYKDLMGQCTSHAGHFPQERHRIRWGGMPAVQLD